MCATGGTMTTKTCFKCGEEKDLEEFYRHPQMADGHLGKCKKCTKEDVRANRAARRKQYSEYEAGRYKDRVESGYMAKAQKLYRQRNRAKYQCRNRFDYALRAGKITKPDTCSECGVGGIEIQSHHDDYEKPYDVKWLCLFCHRALHDQVVVTDNDNIP